MENVKISLCIVFLHIPLYAELKDLLRAEKVPS